MGQPFEFWHEGIIFISIMFFIVSIPCAAVAILGVRLINHIGQYPSKSASLQMSICIQLLAIEIFSFLALAVFFKVFSD